MAIGVGLLDDEMVELAVVPLTAQEAQLLRETDPSVSPWQVIALQCVVAVVLVFLVWAISGKASLGLSVAYGAIAVIIPAALFANGLSRQKNAPGAGAALAGMFVWELVKIVLTVLLLLLAPKIMVELNWLALLAGFVVTMKASWFAMLWQHRRNLSIAKS